MITLLSQKYEDKYIFGLLNPLVRDWFKHKFGKFSPPQTYSVASIHKKANTLISAPTGSGKTLSAFLSIINELVNLSEKDKLDKKVYCIYISPLKALNNDIQRNLLEPLEELEARYKKDLGIKVAVRTGDTTPYQRQKMLKTPPHILITTPESLAIMLVSPKFRELLRDVKWGIIDEIHALACGKRGVDLSLSLERLQELAGPFTRIGLSATVSPINEVAKYLVGYDNNGELRNCGVIDVQHIKNLDLKVISPVDNVVDVTQKKLDKNTYDLLHDLIQSHKTTLIFTNTRAATERVVHNLKEKFGKHYEDNIGAHHSSLSKEHRHDIEARLKSGDLKVAVSSTSLELGIDIGYIDLVILLGSPKSVSKALQRIGRSGHRLHDSIKGRFVVVDRDDMMEDALILKNALEGKIDNIEIPTNCLDVLCQHIFGIAIEGRTYIENVFALVKRSYCYHDLSKKDFMDILKYLAGEYYELELRYVYAKIWYDEETGELGKRGKLARVLHVTNIGTIPDESFISVKIKDMVVGKIDEAFLERMKRGDIFVLGGNMYRFNYSRGMTAQVTPAPGKTPTIPSWFSAMMPLNFEVAIAIQKFRRLVEEKFNRYKSKKEILNFINEYMHISGQAAEAIYNYMREQWAYASIAHDKKLVVEELYFEGKHYLVFHSCYGRRVNDVLARAFAYVYSNFYGYNVAMSITDQNFYLTAGGQKLNSSYWEIQMRKENLRKLLELAIDKTDVMKRRFRHCATRSLMILRNYKGIRKAVGRQQVSAQILINACKRVSNDFPILRETRREVLEDLMDVENATKVLDDLKSGTIRVKYVNTQIPSPFALNLIARGYSDIVKMEDRLDFIKRMHRQVLAKISIKENKSNELK